MRRLISSRRRNDSLSTVYASWLRKRLRTNCPYTLECLFRGPQKNEDIMAEKSREPLLQELIDHPEGAQMSGTGPSEAQSLAERFDPFRDPYLADPYPFF